MCQPIFVDTHEEHEWELEHPLAVEDHPCLSVPRPFFPDLLLNPAIPDFSCAYPSIEAPIVDHSQDTPDISPSSSCNLSISLKKLHNFRGKPTFPQKIAQFCLVAC